MKKRKFTLFFVVVLVLIGCGEGTVSSSRPSQKWENAKLLWQKRDNSAYEVWTSFDEGSVEAKRAASLLGEAERYYSEGIEFLKTGEFQKAQEKFARGAEIAPINPAYYVDLARIYRDQGFLNIAADYYLKAVAALPNSDAAEVAASEYQEMVARIDPGLLTVFDPPKEEQKKIEDDGLFGGSFNLLIAFILGSLVAIVFSLILWRRWSPGVSLTRLIEEAPELHSAIAYLIGSMRHELLKHRMGAVSDVVKALEAGALNSKQREFLKTRLYGGVPIQDAWNAQRLAFTRALGVRLNLNRDKEFTKAGRAVEKITGLRPNLDTPDSNAARELAEAYRQLRDFDRHLASQQRKLVRTLVDETLFNQVIGEVGGEYAVSGIALDELSVEPIPKGLHIEVPREDLILVLKNVLRNAILATSKSSGEKRVGFRVKVSLEPTGQEAVSIGLRDSGDVPLSLDDLIGNGPSSGLGLVTTAVQRYGGALDVAPCGEGYTKEVVVRFFRAYEESETEGRGL